MTIEEFVEEKRGTYDKYYTMYEVCKSLSIQGLSETDHIQNLKDVMKMFIAHPLYANGDLDLSLIVDNYPLEKEEIYDFVYDLDVTVHPNTGEIMDFPDIDELDVRFILKKFKEDSEEHAMAQEMEKCRDFLYFYNNYIRKEDQPEHTKESIEELIRNTLIGRRK